MTTEKIKVLNIKSEMLSSYPIWQGYINGERIAGLFWDRKTKKSKGLDRKEMIEIVSEYSKRTNLIFK